MTFQERIKRKNWIEIWPNLSASTEGKERLVTYLISNGEEFEKGDMRMRNLPFYIVDVFAEEKYAGNQLAVIRGAGALSDSEMHRIAKEMNYSETTFILSDEPRDGGYDVRIFTPEDELPFAGHPTLGTAFIIQQEILREQVSEVRLNLKAGQIPVTFMYNDDRTDILEMKQLPPVFGKVYDAEPIAEILQIDPQMIDSRYPIQEVSTGLPALIVPLKNLSAVQQCRVHRERLETLVQNHDAAKSLLVFAAETVQPGNDLHVRVFVDLLGIPEDPATGSANGCLTGYLVKHRYFDQPAFAVRVEQGYEIGRPSILILRGGKVNDGTHPENDAAGKDSIDVFVGGHVIMTAKGELV